MAIIIIQIIRNNRMDTLDQLSIIIQLMIVPAMRRPRIPRLGYFHFLKAQIIQVTALILVLDQASDRAQAQLLIILKQLNRRLIIVFKILIIAAAISMTKLAIVVAHLLDLLIASIIIINLQQQKVANSHKNLKVDSKRKEPIKISSLCQLKQISQSHQLSKKEAKQSLEYSMHHHLNQ